MDVQICLKKLCYVGVLAFATVDEHSAPQVRNISAIHYEQDAIYFFTARGKNFCHELQADGRVQILGYTMYKEMIRLSGRAVPVDNQQEWINTIFAEQPFLENVYPGETRDIGIIFTIRDMEIEYFSLGMNPIFRESYTLGAGNITPKGYKITDACIGCGICAAGCPQKAIKQETSYCYRIEMEHCLHCGRCAEQCPAKAIRKL